MLANRPPHYLRDARVEDIREKDRQLQLLIVRYELEVLPLRIEACKIQLAVAESRGPAKASPAYRKEIAELEARLKQLPLEEHLLWEQQPGGILAPPPRAKTPIQPQGGQP